MHGSNASNTKDFFYDTPGWDSGRLAKPLVPGRGYRTYVRMSPTDEANVYSGNVYVIQDGELVGMMGQMKFRQIPRLLTDRFFFVPAALESFSKERQNRRAQCKARSAEIEKSKTCSHHRCNYRNGGCFKPCHNCRAGKDEEEA